MLVVINRNSVTLYSKKYYEVRDLTDKNLKTIGFCNSDIDLLLVSEISYERALELDNDGVIFSKKLNNISDIRYFLQKRRLMRLDYTKMEYVIDYGLGFF